MREALYQSRGKGSGSEATAFCSRRLTQPVKLTPIGRLRSTSSETRGSSRTRVGLGSKMGSFWISSGIKKGLLPGRIMPRLASLASPC